MQEFYSEDFQIYPLSAITGEGLDRLQEVVYEQLGISRVYTKSPAKPVDYDDPIVLPNGSKVIEAAMALHKEFAQDFKSARIWGANWYDGQTLVVMMWFTMAMFWSFMCSLDELKTHLFYECE